MLGASLAQWAAASDHREHCLPSDGSIWSADSSCCTPPGFCGLQLGTVKWRRGDRPSYAQAKAIAPAQQWLITAKAESCNVLPRSRVLCCWQRVFPPSGWVAALSCARSSNIHNDGFLSEIPAAEVCKPHAKHTHGGMVAFLPCCCSCCCRRLPPRPPPTPTPHTITLFSPSYKAVS